MIEVPCRRTFGSHQLLLRRLEPGDSQRLLEFFATHTADTIRARYGFSFTELTPAEALKRVSVDQLRDAALGAFERNDAGSHLVAVARFALNEDEESAEMAFVVREDCRHLGIATALLGALIAIARDHGLRALTAWAQRDNESMLDVFRSAGAKIGPPDSGGSVAVTLPLPGPRGRTERPRSPRQSESAPSMLRRAAERTWIRVENASAHLLGNYPLP